MTRGKRSWVIFRRFSDFYKLGVQVLPKLRSKANEQPLRNPALPDLPPKTFCTPSILDEEFAQSRVGLLGDFLDDLLKALSSFGMMTCPEVMEFLEFH